jgi:hypothetical protein
VKDAGKRGVPHWAMVPVLFLTLMVGPIGLLVYLARTGGIVAATRPRLRNRPEVATLRIL